MQQRGIRIGVLRWLLVTVVLAFLAAVASAQAIPEVVFEAHEFAYDGPDSIPSGFTTITVQNEGQEEHDVFIVKLNEGTDLSALPAALEKAMMQGDEADFLSMAKPMGGTKSTPPGTSTSVTIGLAPGRYALMSSSGNDQGSFAAQGMVRELTATEENNGASAPHADAVIPMVDFAFAFPGDLKAGTQTWEVKNVGQQLHFLALAKLAPGKTVGDLNTWMETGQQGEPPAQLLTAGTNVMAPGVSNYITLNLEPGDYVGVCFVTDPATHQSHADLGMMNAFTIGD